MTIAATGLFRPIDVRGPDTQRPQPNALSQTEGVVSKENPSKSLEGGMANMGSVSMCKLFKVAVTTVICVNVAHPVLPGHNK